MDEGLNPTDAQLKDCWDKIDALEVGEILKTADHAPNKPKLWIKCCQMYFDIYRTIRFNKDYTAIKKVNPILTFKQQIERFI